MAGLGMALSKMGKHACLASASDDEHDRKVISRGVFNPNLRYNGYSASSRYYFPDHPRIFVQGPSAGHGIENEILRRVGQHPTDPFNLKAVGIDNQTWEPDQSDVHDMAYVAWSTQPPISVYSEIDRSGGLLDRLGLRDGGGQGTAPKPAEPAGQGLQDHALEDIATLREQLKIAQDGWTGAAKAREDETAKIRKIIADVGPPEQGGGKFAKALREIRKVLT